ncbi:MAG: MotA/TolQ/ExbB proton channel family protein [Pseudomonadota bacterium]|nr:MotA/TolQ/ExbB proton channel family protein [Pseudomonadota bacterium]
MLTYLLTAFSGPAAFFMYALLAVMAFAVAVVIERTITLTRFRCDPDPLIAKVDAAIRAGGTPALALGETPMEEVVRAGLAWHDPELAWEAMAAASVDAELRVRRRIAYLSTVASVATMVGLFGTVYGLILAFGALGDVAAAERAAQLSEGSSTAMATTAFGLLVAIPALAAHAVAEANARELLGNIERVATRLVLSMKAARQS